MKRFISTITAFALMLSVVMLSACTSNELKEFDRGEVSGNVYTSKYAGITFTKPDSWVFASDEEIAKAMDIGLDMIESDEFNEEAAKMLTVTDMMASDPKTNSNIIVTFQNLKRTKNTDITLGEYADTAIKNIKTQMGDNIDLTVLDNKDINFCNDTFRKIAMDVTVYGTQIKQYMYCKKCGDFMAVITVTDNTGGSAETYEAMFS